MAALRWAALNLWSSHDTARDDPPAATTDDPPAASPATTDDETSASESDDSVTRSSESDDSVTRSLPPLETSTTLDGAAFRPPTEPNVDDAAGAWDLHDEPECPVCLEPWAVADRAKSNYYSEAHERPRAAQVDEGSSICARCLRHICPRCAPRLDGRCPLCRGLFPDAKERMTLLENHVAAGRRLAMTCLGECYLYGHVGCPQDAAKALPLLQQAAELGESDALAYLGAAFMEGWAVARDEAKAVAYLRLAARRDHEDALNDLAAALASGTGTNVDKAQAAKLFQRAAERGHSRAAANLAALTNPQE